MEGYRETHAHGLAFFNQKRPAVQLDRDDGAGLHRPGGYGTVFTDPGGCHPDCVDFEHHVFAPVFPEPLSEPDHNV